MNKLLLASCCLLLISPLTTLAQPKGVGNAPAPTQKEEAERGKAAQTKIVICFNQAERNNLKQGSKEYHAFIGECLSQK